MKGIVIFNQLDEEEARKRLTMACGSTLWVNKMLKKRPFSTRLDMFVVAENIWETECDEEDWKEAFSHHPKIGDLGSLEKKFAATEDWASKEQSGVSSATKEVLAALANANKLYEERFGYIFIVHATGKSALEMLEIIQTRLSNSHHHEIEIAAREQFNITALRLEKMLGEFSK